MREEVEMQQEAEAEDTREDYVVPALDDLGSFQELTQFNATGPNPDSEGFST